MKLMMPLAEGFEEIEALAVVDVLRWSGIDVDLVGVVGSVMTGARGVRVMVDKRINEVNIDDYDGIILPGGMPGYDNLSKSSLVAGTVKKMDERRMLIGAICYSPMLLAKLGVLDKRKSAVYPGKESNVPFPRDEKVVVDGHVITSQGPGTAIQFALAIVEFLQGKEKAEKMRKILLV